MYRFVPFLLTALLTACADLGPAYVSPHDPPPATTNTVDTPTTDTETKTTKPTTTEKTTETTTTTANDVDDDNDGYTENEGDCDDTNGDIHPGATEYCDGIDSDCSGQEASRIVSFYDPAKDKWYDRTGNYTGTSISPVVLSYDTAGNYHFCDGTFYVTLTINADISLIGEFGSVELDAGGEGNRVVSNQDGHSLHVRDLTIQYGVGADGGGLFQNTGTLVMDNVVFKNNQASVLGGGLCVYTVNTTLNDVTFLDNEAPYGGALYIAYGLMTIEAGLFADNVGLMGGAVYVDLGIVNANNTNFFNNRANEQLGGAFYMYGSTLTLTNVDLGSDADDNWPDDITIATSPPRSFIEGYVTSYYCDDDGCSGS